MLHNYDRKLPLQGIKTNTMKRVIVYVRVSTDKQDFKRQKDEINRYCIDKGYTIVKSIGEKGSGTLSDREGLIELQSLTSSDGDLVIIADSSRLSREEDISQLWLRVKDLLKVGLDVLFLEGEKYYTAGKTLKFMEVVQLVFEANANSEGRKKILKMCWEGKLTKSKQGCLVSGRPAYGFNVIPNKEREKSKENGKWVLQINNEESKIVKQVYDLVANQGNTVRSIAKHFNSLGMLKRGKAWTHANVNQIIKNRVYTGDLSFSKKITKIEGIVTPELYDKAQEQLKSNHLFIGKGTKHFNQLKGLLKCSCGHSLLISVGAKDKLFYNCLSKQEIYRDVKCNNYGIREDVTKNSVWEVTKAFLTIGDFREKTEEQTKNITIQIDVKQNKIEHLKEEQITSNGIIDNLTNVIIDSPEKNIIPILTAKLSKLITEQTLLNENIIKENRELSNLIDKKQKLFESLQSKLMENVTEEDKHDIFKKYIDKVVYHSVGRFKGFIVITYKNGKELIVMTNTFIGVKAYQLPDTFTFNPKNKKVIIPFEPFARTDYKKHGFEFSVTKKIEYYYEEFVNDFSDKMDEYKMIFAD